MDWLMLTAENQLEDINKKSSETHFSGIMLFKHSTRCSVSLMALSRLERDWKFSTDTFPAYFLDLLQYTSVSFKIAEVYYVKHESPQLLIIKNGKCIYNASHSGIAVSDIEHALNKIS